MCAARFQRYNIRRNSTRGQATAPNTHRRCEMIIRAKTFRRWMEVNEKDYLNDIANHGCVSGFPGLTYYTDTQALYARFSGEIWRIAEQVADCAGYDSVLGFLVSCCNGAAQVTDAAMFENLMVWLVAEEIARRLVEEV